MNMTDLEASIKARRGPATVEILRLRVDLEDVNPVVTRTLLIRATARLTTLHTAIQCAMGWEDCHLHEFEKDGVRYGIDNPFAVVGDEEVESERKQLDTLFRKGSQTLSYLYDFGDSWQHTVTLEEQLPPDLRLRRPRCIDGENACPPEDVGGPGGYWSYLEALLNPQHPEHTETVEWRGPDFHPRKFSVDEAEARLARNFR